MASNSGVATLRNFCWAAGPQKCLLGSLPKPGSLGQNVPKRLAASPPLSRLFLIMIGPSIKAVDFIYTKLLGQQNSKELLYALIYFSFPFPLAIDIFIISRNGINTEFCFAICCYTNKGTLVNTTNKRLMGNFILLFPYGEIFPLRPGDSSDHWSP